MEEATNAGRRLGRDAHLFLLSLLTLFFEILLIRWLSAEIRIFSYFHNLVLLFCFLGIGLGYARAARPASVLRSLALLAALVAALALDEVLGPLSLRRISGYLSAGAQYLIWKGSDAAAVPFAKMLFGLVVGGSMLVACMVLLTAFFVPFGQLLGRLFQENPRPLRAYAANILGSLAGVWLFAGLSAASLPPLVWFTLGGLGSLLYVQGRRARAIAVVAVAGMAALLGRMDVRPEQQTVWSPYQKLTVMPRKPVVDDKPIDVTNYVVMVNSTGYMLITDYSAAAMERHPELFPADAMPYDHYNIAYRFADSRDDVLIVGSGAGNDVAGALRNGAGRVTAVEIDPRIIDIGRRLHPEGPYRDPRVTVVNDDARSFFKKATGRYDLVIFGLLDSHTLSSSYSNVRLDNYVYTTESFREAKRLLKPGGVLLLLFEVQDDFIGARLQRGLADAFGREPIGFTVRSGFRGWGGYGFVAGDWERLAGHLAAQPKLQELVDGSRPMFERWAASDVEVATDDWPYLYLRGRSVPPLYVLIFALLVGFTWAGVRSTVDLRQRMQWPFFFLGAAFLLLEVSNISKSALLFGATWTVNTLAISAVLIMILFSNWVAMRRPAAALRPYYVGLFVSLALSFVVPLDVFAALPAVPKAVLASAFLALPIFFAGLVFSTRFGRTDDIAGALASNLLGAVVGGIAECLSFVVGIHGLLVVAALLYAASLAGKVAPVRVPASGTA